MVQPYPVNRYFEMKKRSYGPLVLASCWIAIFWPGAFVFGLPGVLSIYWQQTLGVGRMEIGRVLFFILTGTGFFMFITGRIQNRLGPRKLLVAGALISASAQLLLIDAGHIRTIYLWAIIMGAASCLVYLPAITVAQLWYPNNRGAASGLVNFAFGFSSAIMAPVFSYILIHYDMFRLVYWMGGLSLVFGFLAAVFIRRPPDFDTEPTCTPNDPLGQSCITPMQSLKTRNFWLIWVTYAAAGAAGISMVTHAVGFGLAKNLPITQAILILSVFSLTSGLSRLISGFVSDYLGRKQTLAATFLLSGFAYVALNHFESPVFWLIGAGVIGFAFGTLFAVSAPLLGELFGMDHFGTIFGMIFTAYGFFAGILGPWLSGYWLDVYPNNYTLVFFYLGAMSLVAAVSISLVKQTR